MSVPVDVGPQVLYNLVEPETDVDCLQCHQTVTDQASVQKIRVVEDHAEEGLAGEVDYSYHVIGDVDHVFGEKVAVETDVPRLLTTETTRYVHEVMQGAEYVEGENSSHSQIVSFTFPRCSTGHKQEPLLLPVNADHDHKSDDHIGD